MDVGALVSSYWSKYLLASWLVVYFHLILVYLCECLPDEPTCDLAISGLGVQATLILANLPKELVGDRISSERLYDAVNVILSYQVSCPRTSSWLIWLLWIWKLILVFVLWQPWMCSLRSTSHIVWIPSVRTELFRKSQLWSNFAYIWSHLQNADGGSATYENTRSYPWLEVILMTY